MRKVITSKVFLVIITAIVCIGVTVYADSLTSSSIIYDNSSSSLTSTNIQDAIDELYNKLQLLDVWKWKIDSISNSNITLDVSNASVLHFDRIYSIGCYDFNDGTGCWPGYIRVIGTKDSTNTTLLSLSQQDRSNVELDVSSYDKVTISEAQHPSHRLSNTGAQGITAY